MNKITIKELAVSDIRLYRGQIDGLTKRYKNGEIDRDFWLTKTHDNKIKIKAIQSLFSKISASGITYG